MFTRAIMACSISLGMTGCSNLQGQHGIADEIISEFSSAVAEKDIEKFKSLFLDENVRWLAIASNKDLMETYKNDPNHKKINDHQVVPFIEWVSRTKENTQVEFSNSRRSDTWLKKLHT